MIILTHVGNNFPAYIETCLKQVRHFNPSIDVVFITNTKHIDLNINLWKNLKINPIQSELLKNDRMDYFENIFGNGWSEFWTKSATRIFYLEEFLKQNNTPILHFENDVMIYSNLSDILDKSNLIFSRLGLTQGGQDRFMTGMFFIKNYDALHLMTNYWINLLSNKSHAELCFKYGLDMIHEMSLFLIYHVDCGENYLGTYPTLPDHKNFTYFNSLFDPASYGQYLGGLPEAAGGLPPGFIDPKHTVGQFMIKNKETWELELKNNIPYFTVNNKKFKLNNLHVHSKKLELFKSYL